MKFVSESQKRGPTRRSKRRSFASRCAEILLLAGLAAGCGVYTFSGGGGMPGHIGSLAILPFDNRTTQFTLTQELTQALLDDVPGRLGLDPASEASADAVLRGTITRYTENAVNFQSDPSGPQIFQRRVTLTVSAEIYDMREDQILWRSGSLSATGEYQPNPPDNQTEEVGRQLAIENLVQKIIDGAQSQW